MDSKQKQALFLSLSVCLLLYHNKEAYALVVSLLAPIKSTKVAFEKV